MDRVIRILHLEDDPHDASLTAAVLAADHLPAEILRVDSVERFTSALQRGEIDVILADYNLPQFDGLAAQELACHALPDVPFIFLSGTLGEEVAIERLKAGATDYVLKQRIARLPSAVRRALAEAAERQERRRAEQEVRSLNAELEQRVRDATSFLEDLVAASPSMVFRLDPRDMRITYASPNVGWILGYSFEEITCAGCWEELLHDDDRDRVVGEIRSALADHAVQIEQEYRLRSKDGRSRWFFGLTRVDYDLEGVPATILRYCLDIADRKAAELEADRANRAKSDFVSRMSHDLRTPLNAILGFAQLLEDDDLTPEQKDNVQLILRGGEHLLGLINELLDIARIEAGQLSLSPEPVDLGEIVQHAVELIAPLAAQREITVHVERPSVFDVAVLVDRQRLNQVLLNLLSNAVKYNRRRGRVTVSFESRPDRRMRIAVTDTGAGILPEKLKLLFTPFERLGAEATGIEGTGLGLAVSHALATAMGGTLGVESRIDHGTTFWVDLAVTDHVKPAPVAVHAAPQIDPSAVEGTVLYIEDNPSNVRLMERLFKRRPHVTIRHAPTGELGVAMAAKERPDMILLDLHLPDMHGEEVLRRLTSDIALRSIPVAVLSADATPEQARRLKAAGAIAYLTKPLDVTKVLAVLDDVLVARRQLVQEQEGA